MGHASVVDAADVNVPGDWYFRLVERAFGFKFRSRAAGGIVYNPRRG